MSRIRLQFLTHKLAIAAGSVSAAEIERWVRANNAAIDDRYRPV